MKKNNQQGSSLLITLLIIAALLSIAFGVSKLGIGETKYSRDIGKTLIAYYVADSGAECQMFADRLGEPDCASACLDVESEICYEVTVSGDYTNRTIKSIGSYQDIKRAIELTY